MEKEQPLDTVVRITTMDGSTITGYAYWNTDKERWVRSKRNATVMSNNQAITLSFPLAYKYACKGQFGSVCSVPLNEGAQG